MSLKRRPSNYNVNKAELICSRVSAVSTTNYQKARGKRVPAGENGEEVAALCFGVFSSILESRVYTRV